MHRIVIVGAGFVGLRVARLLRKKDPELDIFLIDKTDHFLFTPWIIDVLSGDLSPDDISVDLNAIAKRDRLNFILGEVVSVDQGENVVQVKTSEETADLAYDVLVLAQGAKTCYFGIPGAQKNAWSLKTLDDIQRVHEEIHHLFHEADQIADPEKRKRFLSVAVVGAGPAGIESAFSLLHYIRRLKKRGEIPKEYDVKMHVIQAAPQLLPGFSERVVDTAADQLRRAGVLVLTGEAVKKVDRRSMTTSSGKRIPVRFILWTAGVEANAIHYAYEPETMFGGYVTVDNYLRLSDNIFCGGDAAFYKRKGAPIPKTAQSAMQMARVIARNVSSCCKEARLKPFNYSDKGAFINAANIGIMVVGHMFTITSRLVVPFRKLFYRFRFWQMTGFWKAP